MDMWRVVGASVQGASHMADNIPCQDAHLWRLLPGGELLVAVADGAGSAPRSAEGARCAAEMAIAALEEAMRSGQPEDESAWRAMMLEAFRRAQKGLAELGGNPQELRSLATTLTCLVAAGDTLVTGHLGDGLVMVQDGDGIFSAAVLPQRGEYANESLFLTMPQALENVAVAVSLHRAQAVGLMTDGLLRLAFTLPGYVAHTPFFSPLIAFVREAGDPVAAEAQLTAFLASERVSARTDDDKTLVLAVRLSQPPAGD